MFQDRLQLVKLTLQLLLNSYHLRKFQERLQKTLHENIDAKNKSISITKRLLCFERFREFCFAIVTHSENVFLFALFFLIFAIFFV